MRRTKHPGELVKEYVLERKKINTQEFSALMKIEQSLLQELIEGHADVDNDLANKLSSVSGVSAEFWLNMQSIYDKSF